MIFRPTVNFLLANSLGAKEIVACWSDMSNMRLGTAVARRFQSLKLDMINI